MSTEPTYTLKGMKYECPKHGDVREMTMFMTFVNEPELNTAFCMKCLREKMIEIGVSQVKEK